MAKRTLAFSAPLLAAQDNDAFVQPGTHVQVPGQTVNGAIGQVQTTSETPQAQASSVPSSALCAVGLCAAGVVAMRTRSSAPRQNQDRPQVGFAKDGDATRFRRRSEVELKHGRVLMIACMSYIVPEYFKLEAPSLGLKFADVPDGLAAPSKVPTSGLAQMVSFAATVELGIFVDNPKRAPDDFKNAGVRGVPVSKNMMPRGDAKKKRLSAEIANGRLAMMAIIGIFFQDGLTGAAWAEWSLYTDSALRAFESESGVQPPAGFWAPPVKLVRRPSQGASGSHTSD